MVRVISRKDAVDAGLTDADVLKQLETISSNVGLPADKRAEAAHRAEALRERHSPNNWMDGK